MLNINQIEFICKWVKALRSGNYEQTRGATSRLESNRILGRDFPEQCFCSIGVAFDLKVKERPDLWGWERNGEIFRTYEKNTTENPHTKNDIVSAIRQAVNINMLGLRYTDLTVWNDDYQWSFEKIADELEKRLQSYIKRHRQDYSQEDQARIEAALEDANKREPRVLC